MIHFDPNIWFFPEATKHGSRGLPTPWQLPNGALPVLHTHFLTVHVLWIFEDVHIFHFLAGPKSILPPLRGGCGALGVSVSWTRKTGKRKGPSPRGSNGPKSGRKGLRKAKRLARERPFDAEEINHTSGWF